MFRKGGSAEGGITSGLQSPRQGYNTNQNNLVKQNDSSKQRIMNAMGMAPRGRNFNDFLINFGLDIASRPPIGSGIGGAISTMAESAKGPYEQFAKANQAEQNLLRQVGMESEIMDINKENAAAAAAAKDASAMERLKTQIASDEKLAKANRDDDLDLLISTRAQESIADGKYNNYTAATNEAEWTYRGSQEYKDKVIGGVISEKVSNDAKSQAKFAKKQGKKNGVGKIYYDPYKDQVLEVAVINGEYVLRPVGGGEEVVDTTTVVDDTISSNPSYNRPSKPDVITPYVREYMEGVEKQEGEFGSGA